MVELGGSAEMKKWLDECRVMYGLGVVAMCIDVEATICLVMRVERMSC